MKLQEMSTKSLLDLRNAIAEVQTGTKSFATKTKLIARIETIAADKDIDLASFCPIAADEVATQDMQPQAEITGKGIDRLARELLLDPAGYLHAVIAEMVNARIEGAQTTAKSVRWYACKMLKDGTDVPSRRCDRSANIDTDDVCERKPCRLASRRTSVTASFYSGSILLSS